MGEKVKSIRYRNIRNSRRGKETEEIIMKLYGILPSSERLYDGIYKNMEAEIKSCLYKYNGKRYGRITFTENQRKAIIVGKIKLLFIRIIDEKRDKEAYLVIDTKNIRKLPKQPSWK